MDEELLGQLIKEEAIKAGQGEQGKESEWERL